MAIIHKRIRTPYRHNYRADGTLRHCRGQLEIVCADYGVYVRCNYCGEGYKFEYLMPASPRVGERASRRYQADD